MQTMDTFSAVLLTLFPFMVLLVKIILALFVREC
jgi:hypothetical protein